MLEFDRMNRTIQLTILFSCFLYWLTYIFTIFLTNLVFLFQETFLDTFVEMVSLFLFIFLVVIKYISLLFLVFGLIAIFVIFIHDLLIKPKGDLVPELE